MNRLELTDRRVLLPILLSCSFLFARAAVGAEPELVDISTDTVQQTSLTVYPGQGVVSQTLETSLKKGLSRVLLRPDFDNWQLDSLSLTARDGKKNVAPKQQSWQKPLLTRSELIGELVGQEVELFRVGRDTPLTGLLQTWTGDTGLLLLRDNRQEVFQWQEGLAIRTADHQPLPPQRLRPYLKTDFQLSRSTSELDLTYINSGLGYSNQYRLVTKPESFTLDLHLTTTISNLSRTDYHNVGLQLASGDVGGGAMPKPYRARSQGMMMAMDAGNVVSERAGELLFMSVGGQHSLPAGGQLTLPLAEEQGRAYNSYYRYSFYGQSHPGNQVMKDHPVRMVSFTTDNDLPAGSVQVYETSSTSPVRLIHQTDIPQTAGGNEVSLGFGQAYALTVERSPLASRQQENQWQVDWQLKVGSQQTQVSRLEIVDTASNLVALENLKGVKRENGKIYAIIPAGESKTITFTSTYRRN